RRRCRSGCRCGRRRSRTRPRWPAARPSAACPCRPRSRPAAGPPGPSSMPSPDSGGPAAPSVTTSRSVAGRDGLLPAAPPASPALLSALARLRLEGAIFLRGEYTESWALRSGGRTIADLVHPGAERVIMFHVVAAGLCWVQVDGDDERHWAAAGQ